MKLDNWDKLILFSMKICGSSNKTIHECVQYILKEDD